MSVTNQLNEGLRTYLVSLLADADAMRVARCALLLSTTLCHAALLTGRVAGARRRCRVPRAAAAVELTDDSFAAAIAGADRLAVVEFYAPWCRTCTSVAPRYDKFVRQYSRPEEGEAGSGAAGGGGADGVAFYKVNFKENNPLIVVYPLPIPLPLTAVRPLPSTR